MMKQEHTVTLGDAGEVTFTLEVELFELDQGGRALIWKILELVAGVRG